MNDKEKTKEQLIRELEKMRHWFAELQAREAERNEVEEALRLTKAYLRTLLESSPDAIISTDREGNISFFSPGAEALLGYHREETIGRHVVEIYESEELAKEVMRQMREGGGKVSAFETLLRAKDDNLIPVLISASILYDEDGQEAGTVGFNKDLRERKQAEEAVRETEEQIRLLLDSTGEAIYGVDLEGNCTFCNPTFLQLLGYDDTSDLLGKNMHELIHHTRPDGTPYPEEECRIYLAFRQDEGVHVDDEVLCRADGTSFPAEYRSFPVRRDGEIIGSVVTFVDITERKQAEEAVRESQARLAGILDIADDAIISVDEAQRITIFNQGAEKTFGYRAEEAIGKPLDILLPKRIAQVHREHIQNFSASPVVSRGMEERSAIRGRRKDGTEFPAEASISRLDIGGETVFTVILRDITERKEIERKMETLATTDALTKLHNRAYFTFKLEEEFQRAERYNTPLSLILIDIDHFKSVNDTYGHPAGDAYLEAVSELIKRSVRLVDSVARYGGEELAVILPNACLRDSMIIAERLRAMVETFVVPFDRHTIRCTVSIGVASYPTASLENVEELLTAADNALYEAKGSGRNWVVAYSEGMELVPKRPSIQL